jgi:hypothetical protein
VAWLIEHVRPLTQALDALAGDPGEVAAQARTWRSVSASLTGDAADLVRAAGGDVPGWAGAAAETYRQWAGAGADRVRALGDGAGVLAAATEGAGLIVATVRALVRDAIAACVARLITYALEELSTFGLGTPMVIAQVSLLVAKWAARISEWLRALLRSVARLSALTARAADLLATRLGPPRHGRVEPMTWDDHAALRHYTGSGYGAVNRCLRAPAGCTGTLASRADEVSAALAKLDPQPGITFRGTTLSNAAVAVYEPGQVVGEPAFTSTSRALSVAGDAFGGNTLLVIHGRTGRNVESYSLFPNESEVLYDKGTRFRVLDRVLDGASGKWIITLEED